jgi:hypothetical protein
MAGERTFVVKFISDTAKATAGFNVLSGGLKGLDKTVGSAIPGFKQLAIAGTAAFGAVAAGLTVAVKAAMEDQKSQAELQRQLEKTFGANDALTASAERYISVTQLRTGTSDTELRTSLGLLVRATGDLTKSQGLLNTAQDISAATGKDLASVSLALAKASQGQFTALSRLGIPLDDATKKSKDFDKVLGLLNDQFGGAAQAAANTFGGQIKILQGQFGEIVESIGAAVLPYLQKFSDFLIKNVAPAIQRINTVMGEKGLVAAFQQLVFESGNAGPKVVSVFKAITLGAANAINLLAKAYYITSATFKLTTRDFVGAAKDFLKASSNFIDVGAVGKQFDAVAKGIDNYAVRGVPSAIRAQQGLLGSTEDVTEALDGDGKSVSKTLKTATEKLEEYSDALRLGTQAQRDFDKSQKQTGSARTNLATANTDLAKAQENLNRAVAGYGADSIEAKKAQLVLEKAQRDVERAGYRVEESVFAVSDAEKELAKIRLDPESTPQAIREAEINLAEAKLATKDAIDAQTEATNDLATSQSTLNELIDGAIIGSDFYAQFSDALSDAKDRQKEAEERLTDAILAEAAAQERLNDANDKAAELAKKYPKIAATVNQPGAIGGGGIVEDLFSYTNPGGTNSFGLTEAQVQANLAAIDFSGINFTPFANGGIVKNPTLGLVGEAGAEAIIPLSKLGNMGNNINITVNAGLGASGIEVGREIEQYLREYAGFTGQSYSFGSIGSIF